jgi:hypothetical protein
MIQSKQLAIILAFTAFWEIKIEQMVLIWDFRQMMKNNDNIISCVYKIHLLNQDKQMVTPLIILQVTGYIMVYGKSNDYFTSPNFTSFLKD